MARQAMGAAAAVAPSEAPPAVEPQKKDLRIPNTTPEQLAKALLTGGAKPRPETKREREAS